MASAMAVAQAMLAHGAGACGDLDEVSALANVLALRLADHSDDAAARADYSRCLARLGHYDAARRQIERLLATPGAQEAALLLMLSDIEKRRLRFGDAATFAARAAAAGVWQPVEQARGRIAQAELEALPIGRTDVPRSAHPLVLFSCPAVDADAARSSGGVFLGKADYSYAFAARGFLEAVDGSGSLPRFLAHPEYVADARVQFAADRCIHLRFAPLTQPRIVKGAYNICAFAWEFDELPLDHNWPHPFADRVADAAIFDEVWVPSRHGADTLSRIAGVDARYVPSPVLPRQGRLWRDGEFQRRAVSERTLPDVSFVPFYVFPTVQPRMTADANRRARSLARICEGIGRRPRIFLTICNPADRRKQLRPLIEAFIEHTQEHADWLLLIKTSANDQTTASINDWIMRHQLERPGEMLEAYCSDNIWVTNEHLSDDDLDELYAIADFFICTPLAEGQNLPLIEGMLRGCVPVTPRHTAMCDYIDDENAVVIGSHRAAPSEKFRKVYNLRDAEVDVVTVADVRAALDRVAVMDQAHYRALQDAALRTVHERFSATRVVQELSRVAALLAHGTQQRASSAMATVEDIIAMAQPA